MQGRNINRLVLSLSIFLWIPSLLFADGEVTHNETGVKVDHVDFGEDHWNQASGDHIPDSNEIDNIFGEHKGSLNFTHWGSEVPINFALGSGDEVEWDFTTPEAGDYIVAVNNGGADRGGDLHIKDGADWKFLMKVTDSKEIYYYLLVNLTAGTHRFLMRGFDKPYYLHAASWYKKKKGGYSVEVQNGLDFYVLYSDIAESLTVPKQIKLGKNLSGEKFDEFIKIARADKTPVTEMV